MNKVVKVLYPAYKRLKRSLITPEKIVDPIDELSKKERYAKGEFIYQNFPLTFPDAMSFAGIYKEVFDNHIYKFDTQNPIPYIIDCGANVGLSLIYFTSQYPNARIIGFEPDPAIFEYLNHNIAPFNPNNIEIINKGVWSEDGHISFKMEGADAGRISFDYDTAKFNGEIKIETVRLSTYITQPVSMLKIDIEGAELEVIKEVEHKLDLIENVFIEYHSFNDKKQELQVILTILSNNGFRYYIDSPTKMRKSPLVERPVSLSFDLLVNIYAYRK